MANGIEDAIQERAAEAGNFEADKPIVQIIVTVEEDLSRNAAELALASIRREVMGADPIISNVTQDHTVNSFAAVTASALSWEDAQNIRSTLRNAVRDQDYTIAGTAVQADIQTSTF